MYKSKKTFPDRQPEIEGESGKVRRRVLRHLRGPAKHRQKATPETEPEALVEASIAPPADHTEVIGPWDKHGNRLPTSHPIVDAIPDSEKVFLTPLGKALSLLAEQMPILAHIIAWRYDHTITPASDNAKAVIAEEWDRLHRNNERAVKENARLSRIVQNLRTRLAADLKPITERLATLESGLEAVQDAACEHVTALGVPFDTCDPGAAEVLLMAPALPSEAAVLAKLALPDVHTDQKVLVGKVVGWLCTVVVGGSTGVALGTVAKAFELSNAGDYPATLTAVVLLGIAAATGAKIVLRTLAHQASESYVLRRTRDFRVTFWAIVSLVAAAFFIVLDSVVEQGVITASMLIGNHRHPLSSFQQEVALVVSVFVTGGYLLSCLAEGFFAGRFKPVQNHAAAFLFDKQVSQRAMQRDDTKLHLALKSIAVVREAERRIATCEKHRGTITADYERQITVIEEKFLPIREELSEHAIRRHHQALDLARSAVRWLMSDIEIARDRSEPFRGWWERTTSGKTTKFRWMWWRR